MRLTFATLHTHGHLYPLIPLARAARAAGHDVLFATGERFVPLLRELGFRTAVAGAPMQDGFARVLGDSPRPEPETPEWERVVAGVFGTELPRAFAADLEPVLADFRPELVVQEAGAHGAGIAARRAGIPAVCHGFGRAAPGGFAGVGEALRGVAAEFGVSLPEGDLRSLGNPYLDIVPKSLQDPEFLATADRIPLRPVPFAEAGELPPLRPGRALIYLTLGTAFGDAEVLRRAIAGLSALDADVLVAAGPTVETGELGELPGNVTAHAWVPQADLLPHVDLVVHHGGSGTTLASLAQGLPQLLLPRGADQFRNAAAVAEHGSGRQLRGAEVAAESVRDAAAALLHEPGPRERAEQAAAEIAAMPSPEEIAERLPELARR